MSRVGSSPTLGTSSHCSTASRPPSSTRSAAGSPPAATRPSRRFFRRPTRPRTTPIRRQEERPRHSAIGPTDTRPPVLSPSSALCRRGHRNATRSPAAPVNDRVFRPFLGVLPAADWKAECVRACTLTGSPIQSAALGPEQSWSGARFPPNVGPEATASYGLSRLSQPSLRQYNDQHR